MNDLTLQPTQVLPAKEAEPIDVPNEMRSKLVTKVNEHMNDIVEGQVELARGLWYKDIVRDKEGNYIDAKVYQKPPDKDAGQYLLNQVIGKPKENMVVAGKVNFILDI